MYLRILKKDLKRKKTMNIILLLFIILSAMFVASSVNNIEKVTSALDDYFEMADVPDFFAATMHKAGDKNVEEVIRAASSIDNFHIEKILYMAQSNVHFEDEEKKVPGGTNILQGDGDLSLHYFLEDNSILETVEQGSLYMTVRAVENTGLKVGEKITIEIEGISKEFTLAGAIKDAVLGSNQVSMTRYIISEEDFADYVSAGEIDSFYGGDFFYINTSDVDAMLSEIAAASDSFPFSMDRAFMKFTYIFDMIVTGILLVVSLVLIAIAFAVLKFTITFTLSEEFREIGVMKAIGISNIKIRGLYLVKYAVLSIIGSVIGLVFSFPFGKLLMSVSSKSVIIGKGNNSLTNILCSVFVVTVILLFSFGCTGKVKKMSPIDAIRNGQTGERFHKKSLLSLSKSKLPTTAFLAVNDIVSSPKRYGIITLTFFLCLSLLLMLSATVSTLKSDSLISTFNLAECDVVVSGKLIDFLVEGGREQLICYLEEMEEVLAENGMPAKCIEEVAFNLSVTHGECTSTIMTYQGTGTTMDMYAYTAGSIPQNANEIAMTRLAAEKIKADIGDTVTIKTVDGDKEYIITAFFQSMNSQGFIARLYENEDINYIQASGGIGTQIIFTDNPDEAEVERRIEKIKELYPEFEEVTTCAEFVTRNVGVAETLDSVKLLVTILTIILAALITVLMERSFLTKEKGEIALMKAVGFGNDRIYAYHTARFAIIGILAVIIAELLAMPLTHLCIDPVFKMMGMELAVDYVRNFFEMYVAFPLVILVTTVISALVTSLYIRNIKASDTANME